MLKKDTEKPKVLSKNLFPVVGIGASAGGLDAFKKLIKAIPANSGMAYILVQHLHPAHESALPEILQRESNIPVEEITDNVEVFPNHIYVIPSNKMLVASEGVLNLSPRPLKEHRNLPIDVFFTSLSEVHQAHAIGVVLSGTGADGTEGLKHIKDQGGLTFAQDPDTAAYEAMPQHAINADVVDFVLPSEEIPEKLVQLQKSFTISSASNEHTTQDKKNEDAFRDILALLKTNVGVDFNFYKQSTIRRRIIRRMLILQLETITEYYDYLEKNKPEMDLLFHDLLIPVTSFFRDPATFTVVCEKVFPEIIKNKSIVNPLRIWVAGCSTGQEAYTLAMCLMEYLNGDTSGLRIQIFATDLSEASIEKARRGIYIKKEMQGIPEARLARFFTKKDGEYHVKKSLRDMCVFAVHNFLKDPPFARVDLISCRNVLIYLEPYLQKVAFTMFNYALNDKGILLLGKSESIGNSSDLFTSFLKGEKVYTRNAVPGRFNNIKSERSERVAVDKPAFLRREKVKKDDFQKNADDVLLSKYTPVGVVVNERFDIVQFRGLTGEYLEPSSGMATLNVLKMAKEGLGFEIRNALHKAKAAREPIAKEGIPINRGKNLVSIEVIPLLNAIDEHYLVLFRQDAPAGNKGQALTVSEGEPEIKEEGMKDIRIRQLEKELLMAREDMRNITEDQEAYNEELQSANEELLSGSEELQSLNEELETSKEELQSTNEELIIVNQELYDSNEQLGITRRFAEATISTLHEPLVVLDKNFIIKSANQAFYKTYHLTENETLGRFLFELQNNGWDIPRLVRELVKIQKEKEVMVEVEITHEFPVIGKRTICFNIQPIHGENVDQLILIAFNDITLRKNAEKILEERAHEVLKERQMLHGFFMQTPALLHILKGPEHIFELANPVYRSFIGNRNPEGKKLLEAMPELKGQGFVEILDKVYNTGESFTGNEMPVTLEMDNGKMEQRFVNVNYQAIRDEEDKIDGILAFAYDVTEQVVIRKQLEGTAEMLKNLYMNAPAFICTMRGPQHIYDLVNPSYQKIFGKREIVGKPILEALPELKGQGFDKILDNVFNRGETYVGIEVPITLGRDESKLPELGYFNFSYQPIYNENKKINGVLVFGYEVTAEVQGRKIQAESDARFRILADTMPQKMSTTDAAGNINYLNQQWLGYTGKSFEEMKAWGWQKAVHPDDWEITKQTWQHSIDTGKNFQLEHRFLCNDEEYRWHLSRGIAEKDEKGKIIMWVVTHTDIHEQKIKEQKKDEFLSIASHEMRTPLTTAKTYIQLLEASLDKTNGNAHIYAKRAGLSVTRLNGLISELLDVSKIQNGKLNYTFTAFNFNDMINDTVADIQYTSQQHTIVKTGQVNQEVTGDKDRLQQVVINLLTNAIKYSPEADKVFINVEQQNDEIKVSVKDSGIGIPGNNLEKVFDKYFRIEDHPVQFQGLGIGLFISHEIIERHHGKLWAESEPGKGSTFYFTIPHKV